MSREDKENKKQATKETRCILERFASFCDASATVSATHVWARRLPDKDLWSKVKPQ
jgi:hypothetical protein